MSEKKVETDLTISEKINKKIADYKSEIEKLESVKQRLSEQGGLLNITRKELSVVLGDYDDYR